MAEYRFFHPVDVRYATSMLNATSTTWSSSPMETARVQYLEHLGLWDGQDFADIGIILVQVDAGSCLIAYKTRVRVGVM